MKKLLVITTVVLFTLGLSGIALAANTADIEQTAPDNTAFAEQEGSGNDIDVDQDATTISNYVDIFQVGSGNNVDTDQDANNSNELDVIQNGVGNDFDLYQNSSPDTNDADVWQFDDGNIADIDQIGKSYNDAEVYQEDGSNELYVDQEVGAISGTYNDLYVKQTGGAGASYADIDQDAAISNDAYIEQFGGSNSLVEASSTGVIIPLGYAGQLSSGSWNDLLVYQAGGSNDIGLSQDASGSNTADINQSVSSNSLGAYQDTDISGGLNYLKVTQEGSMIATVVQDGAIGVGDNSATIIQRP